MKKLSALLASLSFSVASPAFAARPDVSSLGASNGYASQRYLGTGKGVVISVLDAGVDFKHPALKGALYSQKDFTGENVLDDAIKNPGHGTGIAGILAGRGKEYAGLAPGARVINARVDNSHDVTNDLWAGNGLIWSAKKGARVVNISLGNRVGAPQLTEKFTLMCDYIAERYGVSVVVAGGNDANRDGSAVQQVPAALYNGYAVGGLDGPGYSYVAEKSDWADENDARTKPDLVAPGVNVMGATANWERKGKADYMKLTGTSFAAPMVGGVLAQLIGYGKAHDLPTDPNLLRAILLTSAAKTRDTEGAAWEARAGRRNKYFGYVFTRPLDDEQGAGALDGVAAYRLYARTKAKSTPLNTWKTGKLKGNKAYDLSLGKLSAGQRVDATLTWLKHVAVKDRGAKGLDAKDTFYEPAGLADFTLTLLRDGVPIAASDSDVDNLEHLSWTLEETATYSLKVYRFTEGGLPSENFALAARVQNGIGAAGVTRSLDFEPMGPALAMAAAAVPEPGTTSLIGAAATILLGVRRRRRGR